MPETTATARPSRRAQHKQRTERALQHAALELFAKEGYDTTTTDEIAEKAGVSPRTFFRYFPTKESVLFVGEYGWLQSLSKEFLAQPEELTDFEALRRTLVGMGPGLVNGRRSLVLYEKAIATSPMLRGRVHDNLHADTATVGDAIATRRGLDARDESCELLAMVVLITYRRALTLWLAGPAVADPGKIVADELDLLRTQLIGASNGVAPTSRRARRASTT